MITLKEASQKLPPKDYKEFEHLFYISQEEEHLSPEWYSTRDTMREILIRYDLDDLDPYDFN